MEGRLATTEMCILAGGAWQLRHTSWRWYKDTSVRPQEKAGSAHKMTLGFQGFRSENSPLLTLRLITFKSQQALCATNGRS